MVGGNLRAADLARWFDRRNSTVQGWLQGREPAGPASEIRELFARLVKLEDRIRSRKGLPVPRMSATARIEYIEQLRL